MKLQLYFRSGKGAPDFYDESDKKTLIEKFGFDDLQICEKWLILHERYIDKEVADKIVGTTFPSTIGGIKVIICDDPDSLICVVHFKLDDDYRHIQFGTDQSMNAIRNNLGETLRKMPETEIAALHKELHKVIVENYDDEIDDFLDCYEKDNRTEREKNIEEIESMLIEFTMDDELCELFESGPLLKKFYEKVIADLESLGYGTQSYIPNIEWERNGIVVFTDKEKEALNELSKVSFIKPCV